MVLATSALAFSAQAEVSQLRITKQPNIGYLPCLVMEHEKLIEKHAKAAGLGDIPVEWIQFSSGGAATDALLAGNVEIVTTGMTNMLLLWSRTKGDVKGIAQVSAIPVTLLSRNPNIRTLKDYGPNDKIAVPTVKVSIQAVTLQIGAEKFLGPDKWGALNENTVTLGHPEATVAMMSGSTEITSHFSAPPYANEELKNPAIHVVMRGPDAMGGPASNSVFFSRTKFHDENPKTVKVLLDALEDADKLINTDRKRAAEIYLAITKERTPASDIVEMLAEPNTIYAPAPNAGLVYADFMYRSGLIKEKPASWKDFFFADIHHLSGS